VPAYEQEQRLAASARARNEDYVDRRSQEAERSRGKKISAVCAAGPIKGSPTYTPHAPGPENPQASAPQRPLNNNQRRWRTLVEISMPEGQVTCSTIERMGFGGCFEAVVTAGDVAGGKPDPAMYRLACERLNVAPQKRLGVRCSVPQFEPRFWLGCDALAIYERLLHAVAGGRVGRNR
jgi:hypothetical protein